MTGWLVWLAAAEPEATGVSAVIYGLVLALVAALGGSAFQFYKYRSERSESKDTLISQATSEAVAAAKEMLAEYRLELNRAREEMRELRAKLEDAKERIAALESQLDRAKEDRDHLLRELEAAIERRAEMETKFEYVQARITELEGWLYGPSPRRDRHDAEVADAAREGGREGAKDGVMEANREHNQRPEE